MRKKSLALSSAIAMIATLFIVAGIFAKTLGPDVVRMETEGYDKHERGIVEFNHGKHVVEFNLGCGQCHHDQDGRPLDSFKMGDKAPTCIECHDLDSTHESHIEDYDVACGKCHVDEEGNPLEVMKIENCIECHSTPGLAPKEVGTGKLAKEDLLEYHGEAVHLMCRNCHKSYNEEKKARLAPIACNECHPKNGHE
ncbi:MAG: cytochrome c3 family protein [Desulfobacterales bacterium]